MRHHHHGAGHKFKRAMAAMQAMGRGGQWGDFERFGRGFGGGFGRGWGGDGPRGRRGRMVDSAELRLLLLKLIADEPRHGYALIRAIEDMTGGSYAPSPGVVYPTLNLLVDEELVSEREDGGRSRAFETTDAGRKLVADKADEIEALLSRLAEHGDERADRAPLHRSVKNLMTAVFHQVTHGADADKMHAIVDLLDETARKIERLD